jgi:hypothetical protein
MVGESSLLVFKAVVSYWFMRLLLSFMEVLCYSIFFRESCLAMYLRACMVAILYWRSSNSLTGFRQFLPEIKLDAEGSFISIRVSVLIKSCF